MHLVLGLPGVLAAGGSLPQLPGLARLLHAGGMPAPAEGSVPQALAARYGIVRDGDWPFAALRVRSLGYDAGIDWWLAADPVTLIAGRNDVRIAGPVTDLTPDEAASLVARLNAHFAPDGIRFVAATPHRWFLRAPRPYAITTQPLRRAIGAPLRELLPQGRDSPTWRRWQNEIEMLLHDHPVNRERERRELPLANGLWFADGGKLPGPVRSTPGRITFSGDDTVRALAIHAGEAHANVPADLHSALGLAGSATTLVVVPDAPADPEAIEARWTAPAWRALAAGRLARVSVVADGQSHAVAWEIARPGPLMRVALRFSTPRLSALLANADRTRAANAPPARSLVSDVVMPGR